MLEYNFIRCLICWLLIQLVEGDGMIEVFKWKQMDYYNRGDGAHHSHGHSRHRNRFRAPISNDTNTPFIAYNNVPIGVTHFRGRLFITVPRRQTGIPSTLNYIDLDSNGRGTSSPKLRSYPDFELNQYNHSLQNLVSVYRTSVDECQRLWFIDTGMLEYPNNRQQIRRPSIWIVDLKTDRVIKRFEIPETTAEIGRGMASITIDIENKRDCNCAFAYIPDLINRRLHVYNLENDRIWSFEHSYFNPDPLTAELNIGGQTFRWPDGIFSTTLGPRQSDSSRLVYFHPMDSYNEFVVSNRVLQHEPNAHRSDHGNDFRLLGSRGERKQSTIHEYDPRTQVLFYNEIQNNGVGCWNTNKPFTVANHGTVISNPKEMIYPSDMTIDEDGNIWVMSNSMPIFVYSTLDINVYNFRIWRQNVFDAKYNTVCE